MVDLRRFFSQIHQDYSKDTVVASADVLTVLCVRRVLQMPSDMLIYVRWGHVFFFQPGYISTENPSATSKLDCVADTWTVQRKITAFHANVILFLKKKEENSSKMRHFSLIDPLQEYNRNSPPIC